MKTFISVLLIFQLAATNVAEAQAVIRGDTVYKSLQIGKSKLVDIISAMGKPSSKKKLTNKFSAHLRNGGDIHGEDIYGYALYYKRYDITIEIDSETCLLTRIYFRVKSGIETDKGIQVYLHTFADVMDKYGMVDLNRNESKVPYIYQRLFDKGNKEEKWCTVIRYKKLRFVSHGKRIDGEDVTLRRVDEIWL